MEELNELYTELMNNDPIIESFEVDGFEGIKDKRNGNIIVPANKYDKVGLFTRGFAVVRLKTDASSTWRVEKTDESIHGVISITGNQVADCKYTTKEALTIRNAFGFIDCRSNEKEIVPDFENEGM